MELSAQPIRPCYEAETEHCTAATLQERWPSPGLALAGHQDTRLVLQLPLQEPGGATRPKWSCGLLMDGFVHFMDIPARRPDGPWMGGLVGELT